MLKQRVITAVVLLAILLPALFAPMAWPFAVLTLIVIGAGGWEWGRLNGVSANAPLPVRSVRKFPRLSVTVTPKLTRSVSARNTTCGAA